MSENDKDTTVDPIEITINNLFNEFVPLVRKWKSYDVGSLESWIGLLKQVMRSVEKIDNINGGIAKSTVAIDVLHRLAQVLIDENPGKLTDEQLKTVRFILTEEGVSALKVSAGLLKKLINVIDTNKDGEISSEEMHNFWRKYFCCCCK